MKIAIIGYGIVGQNMAKLFSEADIIDPPKGLVGYQNFYYDLAFICVPTPCLEEGDCNFNFVKDAIEANHAEVFCIKSTIPPGTTDLLKNLTGARLVFSPEYYGETVNANGHDYSFLIIGGNQADAEIVAEAYKRKFTGKLAIHYTDSRTAELVKYIENSFLATKVTFCQEFFRLAEKIQVNYDEARELFLLDPRIGRSHTVVYRDQPYYDSKCLNKDIPALIAFAEEEGVSMDLMRAVQAVNEKHKRVFLKKDADDNQ